MLGEEGSVPKENRVLWGGSWGAPAKGEGKPLSRSRGMADAPIDNEIVDWDGATGLT